MGLKKMLAQGVADEVEQLNKAAGTGIKKRDEVLVEKAISTPEKKKKKASEIVEKSISKRNDEEKHLLENSERKTKKQNLGGRPTNKEKGIENRKKYTLTLKEDTYKLILEKAREEDLSFAKFMEKAALDYIGNVD